MGPPPECPEKMPPPSPTRTRSTCPYCGIGCGVIVESSGPQITGVRGGPDHPANFGRLCPKGSKLHLTATEAVTRQTRLVRPLRRQRRGGPTTPVSWDEALDLAVSGFAKIIKERGPDSVGFYVSGQLLTEHVDHAKCIFIVGSNTAIAHPVLFRRIEDAKARDPSLALIVCDPRLTETAAVADLFLPIKPGAGPFSLTGQPNAMGGREVGSMAASLSGHRDLKNESDRAEVEALWGLDLMGRSLPRAPGKTAVEMFQAAADGELLALFIVCTNPAQSLPDQATVRRALERAELVVVQEAFATTATCAFADLLLPATTWGEKEGTVTNSERRVSRVRAAVPPPGLARADWAIATDFGRRLESALGAPVERLPEGTLFPYADSESIFMEHRESTRGRDLDLTGMTYALLENRPMQWPCREGQSEGRARFVDTSFRPVAEPVNSLYPLSLTTGRLRDQWHGMSRTGTAGRLFGHDPEPVVELAADDMRDLGLDDGDLVRVESRRGSIVLPAQTSAALLKGQTFVAMHWGEEYVSGRSHAHERLAGVNVLTTSAYCPTSRQPELKHAAVNIVRSELAFSLLAMAFLPENEVLSSQAALRRCLPLFSFATCVPFGKDRFGLLFRAATESAPSLEILERLEAHLGLDGSEIEREASPRRRRSLKRAQDGALKAFLLLGDQSDQRWLAAEQRWLAALLKDGQSQGLICACLNVSEGAISTHLCGALGTPEQRLDSLKRALLCGTRCGTCLPELRRLVQGSAGR